MTYNKTYDKLRTRYAARAGVLTSGTLALAVACAGVGLAAPGQPGLTPPPTTQGQPGLSTTPTPPPAVDPPSALGAAIPSAPAVPTVSSEQSTQTQTYTPPLSSERIHTPIPTAPRPVIAAAPDELRLGTLSMPRPAELPRDAAAKINGWGQVLEYNVKQGYDSIGFSPQRSDRLAASTIAGGVIGGVTGAVGAGAPAALLGAGVGAGIGAIAGGSIGGTFGVVTIPVVGVVPGTTAGAVIGAAAGAAIGAAGLGIPVAITGGALGAVAGAAVGTAVGATDMTTPPPPPAPLVTVPAPPSVPPLPSVGMLPAVPALPALPPLPQVAAPVNAGGSLREALAQFVPMAPAPLSELVSTVTAGL